MQSDEPREGPMTGTTRFVCTDPDAGDFEFADIDAVLDAIEAALVQPATPLFDAVRQSWQPVGMHPEIRAAWEARLRYRPPAASGLGLPALPSMTALARSLPDEVAERELRRDAFARIRAALPVEVRTHEKGDPREPRFAAVGLMWALVVLAVVGWALVIFATRLSEFAAAAGSITSRK
jgi:hypothetical protein